MPNKAVVVLGINPGSKYLGISVFQGPDLRDWRVKVMKGKWSEEKTWKALNTICSYIDRYNPDALSIKKLNPSRSSPELNRLAARVIALAEKKGIRVYQSSIKELEVFFSPEERINKRTLAEIIASQYQVLFYELAAEKSSQNPYYLRMFEAVALGAAGFHKLDNSSNKQEYAKEKTKNIGHRSRHQRDGLCLPGRRKTHPLRCQSDQKTKITT